jgi:catechol 2,3-dioxygenase-like lactoylglutathione lyase family enzyme
MSRLLIGLNVRDLSRSARFYELLLGARPAKQGDQVLRFSLQLPPVDLALRFSPPTLGGGLNHLGLRLPDSAGLVQIQRRLEEAGISTQRQEGVACCYSRQTKFWAADPDQNLWEIYTLEEDLEHSGFEDDAEQEPNLEMPISWEHRIFDDIPAQIPHEDNSLSMVRLEGTWNASLPNGVLEALLEEVFRRLHPGGKLEIHALVSNVPFPGTPDLPGPAAVVQRVPVIGDVLTDLRKFGLTNFSFENLGKIHCFEVAGVELREMRLVASKPFAQTNDCSAYVLYRGPFQEVTNDDGTVFRRGERVLIGAERAELLRCGELAEQFAFLPNDGSCC